MPAVLTGQCVTRTRRHGTAPLNRGARWCRIASVTRSPRWLAVPLLAFALVSLTAGLLADHKPRSKGYFRLWFSDPVHLKAGFATAAVALALFQLFSAAWIFKKLPWTRPAWIGR